MTRHHSLAVNILQCSRPPSSLAYYCDYFVCVCVMRTRHTRPGPVASSSTRSAALLSQAALHGTPAGLAHQVNLTLWTLRPAPPIRPPATLSTPRLRAPDAFRFLVGVESRSNCPSPWVLFTRHTVHAVRQWVNGRRKRDTYTRSAVKKEGDLATSDTRAQLSCSGNLFLHPSAPLTLKHPAQRSASSREPSSTWPPGERDRCLRLHVPDQPLVPSGQ